MDKTKISKIIKEAQKKYEENKEDYNKLLNNSLKYYESAIKNFSYKKNFNQIQDFNQIQNSQNLSINKNNNYNFNSQNNYIEQPNYQNNIHMPQINVIPDPSNPGAPINIIAKNYISPETLEGANEFEERKQKHISLTKIPDKLLRETKTDWEPINYRDIKDHYKLYELSEVDISYEESTQKLIYKIIEPELTNDEKEILKILKKGFIYVFEKVFSTNFKKDGKKLINEGAKELIKKYGIKVDEEQFKKLTYYLYRDFLGLEVIEPIFHDPYIEDISCDGLNIPIFVNHLKYGALEVNRKFETLNSLNSFIIKLAQKCNKEVSLSKPILQGSLPDGSRVEAIYGREVSEKGSSFTIRKFRAEPFTPIHLIDFGTMPAFLLSYLWLAIENKQSVIVSGSTATGKTTVLNALSLFVPPTSKIVSIEDTPEINLPHEHWLPMVARESNEKSKVSMFDLLKASLRERPDYIIVGEIRGKEASVLFQGMATGHAGLSTVHAEKFNDLVNRMTIDPINLPKQLLTEVNIIIFLKLLKVKNNMVRRVSSVIEVIDYDNKQDKFFTNEFVSFKAEKDEFIFKEKSSVISHLIDLRGGKEEDLWREIEKRRRILDLMHEKKIMEFEDVNNIFLNYYKDSSKIFDYINNYKTKNEH